MQRLGLQTHIGLEGRPPAKRFFKPVSNRPTTGEYRHTAKPSGGFWTSTYVPEIISAYAVASKAFAAGVILRRRYADYDWVVWAAPMHRVWTMKPHRHSKVAVIDGRADYMGLGKRYGWLLDNEHQVYSLDFEALAADLDAVHLTARGYEETKDPNSPYTLDTWQHECTIWFRWVFGGVKEVGPMWPDFPMEYHYIAAESMKARLFPQKGI